MEWYIPLITIILVVVGYYSGHLFRDRTHAMIPFNEPLSMMLLAVTLAPLFLEAYFPDLELVDPFDLSVIAVYTAFWVGYLIGYMQNRSDLLYVCVHDMMAREEDVHPIVRYTNKEGRSCWQPQSFKEICKTVFLGNDNYLTLTANVQRKRDVTIQNAYHIRLHAEAVDVTKLIPTDKERVLFTLFGHDFIITSQDRIYKPTLNSSEESERWVTEAMQYEDIFTEYTELEVQMAEFKTQLRGAEMKGGAMVLNRLFERVPSNYFMEGLSDEFENIVNNREMKRVAKKATAENARGPVVEATHD